MVCSMPCVNLIFKGCIRALRAGEENEGGKIKMYVPDNLDQFNAHSEKLESELSKLPECSECGKPIQEDTCFDINDELICHKCMNENHRVWTDDYI